MLLRLLIEKVALIERLTIDFNQGFNVLTGETGAGKSIIIDAVNLVLGERAAKELIKHGADKARVDAVFAISKSPQLIAVLKEMGINVESELALSRELSLSGKNVCRINGILTSLAALKRISDLLVDVHGQHEHQTLFEISSHIRFLDSFGGERVTAQKQKVFSLCEKYFDIRKQMLSGFGSEAEREREIDMCAYQIKEIEAAGLRDGEEEELLTERGLLQNAERIIVAFERTYDTLTGEGRTLCGLNEAARAMEGIAPLSKEYEALAAKLNDAYYAAEDIALSVRDLKNAFEYDPKRLDKAESRLALISDLKRKYGDSELKILQFKQEAQERLFALKHADERNAALKLELEECLKEYKLESELLSAFRHEAAGGLEKRLLDELKQLGLDKARFSVDFTVRDDREPCFDGIDDIEFLLSANTGEPLKPLAKVASGGEISRIMLAFKTIFADKDQIETLIFDEIDAGISGKTAGVVGEKMSHIASTHQVICITHLPQIAALASSHYDVQKTDDGHVTDVYVRKLSFDERAQVISRMLGGGEGDVHALEHAKNLILKSVND